MGLWLRITLWT